MLCTMLKWFKNRFNKILDFYQFFNIPCYEKAIFNALYNVENHNGILAKVVWSWIYTFFSIFVQFFGWSHRYDYFIIVCMYALRGNAYTNYYPLDSLVSYFFLAWPEKQILYSRKRQLCGSLVKACVIHGTFQAMTIGMLWNSRNRTRGRYWYIISTLDWECKDVP